MIHKTMDFGVESMLAPEYNKWPLCCDQPMVLLILDEWMGAATLTFYCTDCRRYVIK